MHDPADTMIHAGLLDDPAAPAARQQASLEQFQAVLNKLLGQAPPYHLVELASHFPDDGYYGSDIRRLLLEWDE